MYLIAALLEMGDYYFALCLFGVYMILGDWELVKFLVRIGFEKQITNNLTKFPTNRAHINTLYLRWYIP